MFKLMASCDSLYLRAHAPALVASAAKANNNLHINAINGTPEDIKFLHKLSEKYHSLTDVSTFSFSYNPQFVRVQTKEEQRTVYACDRFITVNELMHNSDDTFLIVDIDCVIMKHIDEPEDQVGLFIRESLPGTQGWEQMGTRIAAGAVYYSQDAKEFARSVAHNILRGPYNWFLDQVAINTTYENMMSKYRYSYFDETFMDWHFKEGTYIWTGKGDRKYNDIRYTSMKKQFEELINA